MRNTPRARLLSPGAPRVARRSPSGRITISLLPELSTSTSAAHGTLRAHGEKGSMSQAAERTSSSIWCLPAIRSRRQINLIRVLLQMSAEKLTADQNGGSVRVLLDLPHHSA